MRATYTITATSFSPYMHGWGGRRGYCIPTKLAIAHKYVHMCRVMCMSMCVCVCTHTHRALDAEVRLQGGGVPY